MNWFVVAMMLLQSRSGATGRGAFMAALAGLHGGGGDDSVRARCIAEHEAYVRELDAQVWLPSKCRVLIEGHALSAAADMLTMDAYRDCVPLRSCPCIPYSLMG